MFYADAYALDIKYLEEALKKLLFLLVVMILALVAFPIIASEPIGPPGDIVAMVAPNIQAPAVYRNEAIKEIPTIDYDSVVASALFMIVGFSAIKIGFILYSITHKTEHGITPAARTSGVA